MLLVSRFSVLLLGRLAIVFGLALPLLGCGDETIRVAVSADALTDDAISDVRIQVFRNGEERVIEVFNTDYKVKLPAAMLLENGEPDAVDDEIRVVITGLQSLIIEKIRRSATLRFSTERSVLLHMPLCNACIDKACDTGTCKAGACVDDYVKVADLPEDDDEASLQGDCGGSASGCTGRCGEEGCGPCPSVTRINAGAIAIDATEVTRAAYKAWLDTSPNPAELGDICAAAVPLGSFASLIARHSECMASPDVCQQDCDAHPQVCITSCAAEAYCRWAGGRLCVGSPNELVGACREGPLGAPGPYPYGATYEPGRCNDASLWPPDQGTTKPVGSMAGCEGSYSGLLDMSGNVSELTAKCTHNGSCDVRGGSYGSTDGGGLRCDSWESLSNFYTVATNIGFRCCYTP